MASVQAHIAVWLVKWRIKRRLKGERDVLRVREILRPDAYKVPKWARVTSVSLGGIQGECVEGIQRGERGAGGVRSADRNAEPGDVAVLYLHGGGYFGCSAETDRPISCSFAREGFRVYAPDYRLAPEHPFPAALEDAVAAYHGVRELGFAAERIVVAGLSAGGGLTLALLLALRAKGEPLPAGGILFSPWTDLAATGESIRRNTKKCALFDGPDIGPNAQHYVGKDDARNPLISPLYGEMRGLPPMLIHVGADETLLDDSTRVAEKARAAGVEVELKIWRVVPHGWQLAPQKVPEARQSLREAAEFARKHAGERKMGNVGLAQDGQAIHGQGIHG